MKIGTYILAATALFISVVSVQANETYRVNVSRVGDDLYEEHASGLIVKTLFCFEYATRSDAILIIENQYGFNIGRLIFLDGSRNSCDVEKILG